MDSFFSIFVVVFREGLEALLIVGITAAYLRQTGRGALLASAYAGVAGAVAASAAIGWLLAGIGVIAPAWEGVLALAAAVLVGTCTVHVLRVGRAMKQQIVAAVDRVTGPAASRAPAMASVGIAAFLFLMVTREGVEAATMIAAVSGQADGSTMALGGVLGFAAASLVAAAWAVCGRRVNLGVFFRFAGVFLILFSIQLVIYAFHEFAEAEILPFLDNAYWHDATEPFGPEGEFGPWLTYAMAVIPTVWLIALWAFARPVPTVPAHAD